MTTTLTQQGLQALTQSLTLAKSLENLLHVLQPYMHVDGIFSNVLHQNDQQIEFLATVDDTGAFTRHDQVYVPTHILAQRANPSEQISRCDRIEQAPLTAYVSERMCPDLRSFLMVKARLEGRHYGIICFWSKKEFAFTDRDIELIRPLVNALSLHVGFASSVRMRQYVADLEEKIRRQKSNSKEQILQDLISHSPSMRHFEEALRRIAPFDATVLITGPSGSGKEVLATAVHKISTRRDKPFIKINCGAIAAGLIESELFGYEKGAFTGAVHQHNGLFEQADGGTLFLDEIGDLDLNLQVKLLRVLQQKSFRRIGGTHEISVDVRIIAATHKDLVQAVKNKEFRLDLYYRLNVFPLHLKGLAERHEDLRPLGEFFLTHLAQRYRLSAVPQLSNSALEQARQWSWPGNVREWRNVLERAVIQGQSPIVDLPIDKTITTAPSEKPLQAPTIAENPKPVEQTLPSFDQMQYQYFKRLLESTYGKIAGENGAARLAGMHPNTLRSRLAKLGLL